MELKVGDVLTYSLLFLDQNKLPNLKSLTLDDPAQPDDACITSIITSFPKLEKLDLFFELDDDDYDDDDEPYDEDADHDDVDRGGRNPMRKVSKIVSL